MKLSIVMPVFNEGVFVSQTLQRVWEQSLPGIDKEIIIVESNSSDDSRLICKAFVDRVSEVDQDSVKLVLQNQAKGKGNAVRAGLKHATGDIILIQDADAEYDTKDYGQLLSPILEGKVQFVLGSRHLTVGNWKIRSFESSPLKAIVLNIGGFIFHAFFNLLYGTRLTDPTTMYKVFKRSCIEGVLFEADRFDFDFELLGKLIRLGYHPVEVPVSYVSRGFEEGKKIDIFRDPWTWIKAIVRYRLIRINIDKCQSEYMKFSIGESLYCSTASKAVNAYVIDEQASTL
jgi:glycosyltransferase involved in cell wall biosynthesis